MPFMICLMEATGTRAGATSADAAGAMVRYTGERLGDRCRVEALPTPGAPLALVWMDCVAVGVR